MEKKIIILSDDVINKIAAGEVVQRPSSALKELLENSIDANANKIEIEIVDGGKTLLLVSDNGFGMSQNDTILSVQRHSTSKISKAEDLQKLSTFGFRGEALASIASVSQFEIKTKTADSKTGFQLKILGGKILSQDEVSCNNGTMIIVKNLFFNTPARFNFLKTTQTEFRSCYEVFIQIALAHPEIEFKFKSNNEILLNLKSEDLASRIESIFGEKIINTLLSVNEKNEYVKIDGFISKPNYTRKAKRDQFIFINKRFVISPAIQHAVYSGFEHLIEKASFPFFVLNLEISGEKIDVNVHPSKLNVKFSDESFIYKVVHRAVRNSLKTIDLSQNLSFIKNNEFSFNQNTTIANEKINFNSNYGFVSNEAKNVKIDKNIIDESKKYLGQIENKYLIFQTQNGITIIDQHVAHERILFEKFTEYFQNHNAPSQQLLFPIIIKLSPSDFSIISELKNELENLGFKIKEFGGTTIVLESVPVEVKSGSEEKILIDVIDEFKNNLQKEKIIVTENLSKSLACKAAVKAGDKLNIFEVEKLITDLFKTKIPFVCPHGRPVVLNISIEELDKKFLRI